MAIALVASASTPGTDVSSTTMDLTVPATSAGTVLLFLLAASSASPTGISGGGGTSGIVQNGTNAHNWCPIWGVKDITPGTTTFTVTFGSATTAGAQVYEFSGIDTTDLFDVGAAADGVSTAPSVASGTPSNAVNLIVSNAVVNTTFSAGPSGGMTALTPYLWQSSRYVRGAYIIQAAATPNTCAYTLGASANWDMAIAVLNPATSDESGASSQSFGWGTAATGTAGTVVVPTAPSGFYGPAIGVDTKANVRIGDTNSQKLSVRFRCTQSSAVASILHQERGDPGYGAGTGGTIRASVQTDSGGVPSGTILGSITYSPGISVGGHFFQRTLVTSALTAGQVYHLVYENVHASPGSNYISINQVFMFSNSPLYLGTQRQPRFANGDFDCLNSTGGGGYSLMNRYLADLDITYANGGHDGCGYIQNMIDMYGTTSGSSQRVRELFTVSGGDRIVTDVWVRVRRAFGSGNLALELRTSGGTLIDQYTVPSSSVPISAAGGDNGGSVWVGGPLGAAQTLASGSTYQLLLTTDSSTSYTAAPIRKGAPSPAPPGYSNSLYFKDGRGQKTTDGTNYVDLYTGDGGGNLDPDIQFFFIVTAGSGASATGSQSFGWSSAASGLAGMSGTSTQAWSWATEMFGTTGVVGTSTQAFAWATAATASDNVTGISEQAFGFDVSATGLFAVSVTGVLVAEFSWSQSSTGAMGAAPPGATLGEALAAMNVLNAFFDTPYPRELPAARGPAKPL